MIYARLILPEDKSSSASRDETGTRIEAQGRGKLPLKSREGLHDEEEERKRGAGGAGDRGEKGPGSSG